MHPTIKTLKVDDIEKIIPYEQELFLIPFKKEDYLFDLTNNIYATYLKLEKDNQIIGWAGIHCLFEESHLITIGIIKQEQSKGYGRYLCELLIDIAKEKGCQRMVLEVDATNTIAKDLYESLGFKFSRVRKNYYMFHDGYEMIYDWSEE